MAIRGVLSQSISFAGLVPEVSCLFRFMHLLRRFFLHPRISLSVLCLTLPITLALASGPDSVWVVPPAFLAGLAESLTNGRFLALLTVAGVLALAKGIGLPFLWAISAMVGVVAVQLGCSIPVVSIPLILLFCCWLLNGKRSASEAWIALFGSIACGLPLVRFDDVGALTGNASLTVGLSLGSISLSASGIVFYCVGLLLGLLSTSLAAYQVAFWFSWHLGDRVDNLFRLGGLVVVGLGAAFCSRHFLGL